MLAAVIAFCGLASARAQTPLEVAAVPFTAAAYRVGERLTYNVSYSQFTTAAHVELSVVGTGVYDGRNGVELRAHVETLGIVGAAMYSINNDYISVVDPSTGLPFRSQRRAREAGSNALPGGAPAAITTMSTRANAFDFLSAIHRLRALPVTNGGAYRITVSQGAEQFDAVVRTEGRELINTSVGSYNAVIMSVRVPGNRRADDFRLRVYISDDAQRLPVRFTAQLNSSEISADLASVAVEAEPPAVAPPAPRPTPIPPIAAQPKAGDQPAAALSADLPFAAGEQLNYQVYLGSGQQHLATMSYLIRPRAKYFNRDGLLFTATAQTNELGNRLFVINDQINSYVDPVTLLPFRTEVRLQEGRRRVTNTLTVEQDRGIAVTDKGQSIEIPVGTHDLVSVLYAMRSFDLRPRKRNAVSLLVNGRPRALSVDFVQRETITLGAQEIPAIQLALTTDDPENNRFGVRLWVGNDARRLPLRITATTPLGSLRADLVILPSAMR